MSRQSVFLFKNKTSVTLLIMALIIGGVSAQADELLNTTSSGYLVCVDSKTKVVTHPDASKCPKSSKKIVLGSAGARGLTGAAGLPGKDGRDGVDGKTLWNGIKDPENSWGAPGDMFINAVTKTIFGPKDLTTGWPAGVSMVGPKGDQGPIGLTGATGPQGPGGSGPAGPAGPTGPAGANGTSVTLSCAQGGTCVIGDTGPGGGKVFIVQTATATAPWRYMEVAPNTWSGGSADPEMKWCSSNTSFVPNLETGSTGTIQTSTGIGKGFSNSQKMIRGCTFGAAIAAASYNGGGKSDWHIPSKNELNQMCKWQRGQAWISDATICNSTGVLNSGTGASGFAAVGYWSSSEGTVGEAWAQGFGDGYQFYNYVELRYVRPVRAF